MYPQTDNDLTAEVWRLMQDHKGYQNRIDRQRLTFLVFGKVTDSKDRKVRDALSDLPVVWNDGYFVPTSREEAQDYIAQMHSRQASIGQRLRVLDEYLRQHQQPVRYEQQELINYR